MLKAEDFQVGAALINDRSEQVVIDEDMLEVFMAIRNYYDWKPIELTKEILKNNLGFEVHDLGDYWRFEKGDFTLTQPVFQLMAGIELPFIFGYKTGKPKTISFKYVHHLQNVYHALEQKTLEWRHFPATLPPGSSRQSQSTGGS